MNTITDDQGNKYELKMVIKSDFTGYILVRV